MNFSAEQFFHLVEAELRKQARILRASRSADPVLQTTLLVNEAFLRLKNGPSKAWRDQSHFLRLSCGVMKRILAYHDRRQRPGQLPEFFLEFDQRLERGSAEADELVHDFADAFQRLDSVDPSASAAFSLCFFHSIGLSNRMDTIQVIREFNGVRLPMREVADRLDTSGAGVCRALDRTMAFLSRELRGHAV